MKPLACPDVLVLGAGPAGALLAWRLASLGHAVQLVHGGAAHAPTRRLETLAPSVDSLLASLGLPSVLAQSVLGPPQPLRVDWPGSEPPAAPPQALLVDRERFDAALRAAAMAAGAHLSTGRVRRLDHPDHGPLVQTMDGLTLPARLVVDARGRRAAPRIGPGQVALMVLGPTPPGVAIEAAADQRQWSAGADPRHGLPGVVAAFVAPSPAQVSGGSRAQRLRRCLPGWAELGEVALHDASARAVADAAPQPRLLLVGDAAVALDPLSSQGVAAALRSALQAAAVLHTALARPSQAALAWRFHRLQQRRLAQQHTRLAAGFREAAAAAYGSPFWSALPGHAGAAAATPLARDWPPLHAPLCLADAVSCRPEPVLEDGWIAERPALVHPAQDQPVAWLAGAPVEAWIEPLRRRPTLAELLDTWHARFGAERTAAVWPRLWRQGWVVSVN
jgi:2-polyprenyl-6-methoxyphenol hydroxylase-like FAD-dependent oxidoreductase